MNRRLPHFLLALALLLLPVAAVVAAQPPGQDGEGNRAALVIRSGDDQVDSYCVDFDEPEISGYELLQRAGREIQISDAGLGVSVCRLDDVGCPGGDCFCQCKGDPCVYWSYWHQREGEWQYAAIGASTYMVQPGAVEGWSWGPGSVTEAIAPPSLSFDDVCGPAATAAEPASLATEARPTPTAAVAAVMTPAATATPVPETANAPGTNGWLYGLFALIVLALGATLWWLQRRERVA